ncbi:hypothetical protein HOY80DRAFT_883507, partial [Tuber brumale]
HSSLLGCVHKNQGCDTSDLLLCRKDDCKNWKQDQNKTLRQLTYRSLLHL